MLPATQAAARLDKGLSLVLAAVGLLIVLAVLVALPDNLVFAVGVAMAIGVGLMVADLRRHGGPNVPALPFVLED